jgi:hypothetical protein
MAIDLEGRAGPVFTVKSETRQVPAELHPGGLVKRGAATAHLSPPSGEDWWR